MRSVRTILAVLLALAWTPLTAHCQIESVTGLELLHCASVDANGTPTGSPCEDTGCCGWESGQYHLPAGQPEAAVPLCAVLAPVAVLLTEAAEANAAEVVLTELPPKPPKPWQFSLRAALPVRAPSLAS